MRIPVKRPINPLDSNPCEIWMETREGDPAFEEEFREVCNNLRALSRIEDRSAPAPKA